MSEAHPAINSTFHQTALASPRDAPKSTLTLPNGYNVVAVRETLLSEASFVTRTNKPFWRRMMDNEQFVTMFTAGFHHVLDCVSENGMVLIERLTGMQDSEFIHIMSSNLAEMYYTFQRGERDVFLPKLPELICFMIINALQAAVPKHQRIFNSIRFRELIIDWSTELVGGIRNINTRVGKEWFFVDASDLPIMCSQDVSSFSSAMTECLAKRTSCTLPLNSVGSRYHLDHSPLVAMFIDKNNPSLASSTAKNVLHVTLSHDPDRPLMSLQKGLMKTTKFREKKVDLDVMKDYRKEAQRTRTRILKEYSESKTNMNDDINRLHEGMRASIAMLKGKKISKKSLIAELSVTQNPTT